MRHRVLLGLTITALLLTHARALEAAPVALAPSDLAVIRDPEVPDDARVLVRFEVPSEVRGARVDLAVLELQADIAAPDSVPGIFLDAFPLTTEWGSGTVDWREGWETPGGDMDGTVHASWIAEVGEQAMLRFDLTDMLQGWSSGARENHGLTVRVAAGEVGALCADAGRGADVAGARLSVWHTPTTAAAPAAPDEP